MTAVILAVSKRATFLRETASIALSCQSKSRQTTVPKVFKKWVKFHQYYLRLVTITAIVIFSERQIKKI